MSWKLAVASFVSLSAVAGTASAQQRSPEVLQGNLDNDLSAYIGPVLGIEATGKYDNAFSPDSGQTTQACLELVDTGTKLGIKPDRQMDGREGRTYAFRDARALCAKFDRYKATVAAVRNIGVGWRHDLDKSEPGHYSADFAQSQGEAMKECLAKLDAAVAAGADPDLEVRINSGPESIKSHKADCQRILDWSATYAKDTAKALADQKQAAADRYKKFGAAGDKLEWLTYYDPDGTGSTWYVPPSCKGVDDPKALAKAKVLIRWTVDDDGTQHLRRLQFKGNKLVKDTERSFLTEAAAYRGCK